MWNSILSRHIGASWTKFILATAATLALLAACSPIRTSDQLTHSPELSELLYSDQTVSQTFLARHAGLNQIGVQITEIQSGTGEMILATVMRDTQDPTGEGSTIATVQLALEDITAPGVYTFTFPAQPDSYMQTYRMDLSMQGEGSLSIAAGEVGTYLEGSLYADGSPKSKQMSFRLGYEPWILLVGLFRQGVQWALLAFAAFILFILPGMGLLAVTWPEFACQPPAVRWSLAGSLSLSIYPVLMYFSDLLNLKAGSLLAWFPPVIGLGLWILHTSRQTKMGTLPFIRWPNLKENAPLIFVLVIIALTRLWQVRAIQIPLWVDSNHHTMITKLLIVNRGLFTSWEPLAALQSFSYHFGFHANAAAYEWLTGLETPSAVLYTAQWINLLAIACFIPLTFKITKDSLPAAIVLLIVGGLLSPMPSYYVNWGRYTQLAGQAILGGWTYILWCFVERQSAHIRQASLLILASLGLLFTHYRIAFFAALFAIILLLWQVRNKHFQKSLLRIAIVAVATGILFVPWLLRILESRIYTNFARQMSTAPKDVTPWMAIYNAIGDPDQFLPYGIWVAMLIILAVAFWKKASRPLIIAIWWVLILMAANPQWFNLPGQGVISNFAVLIAAYIPASLLLAWGMAALDGKNKRLAHATIGVLLALGIWAARGRMVEADPSSRALALGPDRIAANWLRQNTPADSTILINASFSYGGTLLMGTDGGLWLPILADRQTTLPPLNYGTEKGPFPEYRNYVRTLPDQILQSGLDSPATLAMLQEREISHVYLGQQRAAFNTRPLLDEQALLASKHYNLIYAQDQVRIFEVTP